VAVGMASCVACLLPGRRTEENLRPSAGSGRTKRRESSSSAPGSVVVEELFFDVWMPTLTFRSSSPFHVITRPTRTKAEKHRSEALTVTTVSTRISHSLGFRLYVGKTTSASINYTIPHIRSLDDLDLEELVERCRVATG
jgi:hypothetical protein